MPFDFPHAAHMKRLFFVVVTACSPIAALGQSALSADAFDALTQGQTFTYSDGVGPYGREEYLSDRRVRWSFLDGKCKDGTWWEEDGKICFVYEDNLAPQCWSFYEGAHGLTAKFENSDANTTLYEVERSENPLLCLGPEVGV